MLNYEFRQELKSFQRQNTSEGNFVSDLENKKYISWRSSVWWISKALDDTTASIKFLPFAYLFFMCHETGCNTEVHCGVWRSSCGRNWIHNKGDIPQASSCGLFRSSEAGKKAAVVTSPWSNGLCLVISLSFRLASLPKSWGFFLSVLKNAIEKWMASF